MDSPSLRIVISTEQKIYTYKWRNRSTFENFTEKVSNYVKVFNKYFRSIQIEVVITGLTTSMKESSSSGSWNDSDIDRLKKEATTSESIKKSSADNFRQTSDMGVFINRLASYRTWPDDALMSAVSLSNCGLYYTGRNDEVKCHECGAVIGNWRQGDLPLQRHHQVSPNCKIVVEQIPQSNSRSVQTLAQETRTQTGASNYNTSEHAETLAENETLRTNLKKKPVIIHENSTTNFNISSNNNNFQSNENTSKPLAIRSTSEALDVMSRTPTSTTNNWFNPRDTTIQTTTSQPVDYTIETNRLASFVGNWSSNAYLQPTELASAGLYFTGPGDRVQCAWCRGGLYNWEQGDTAIGEHIRHFPDCPFIKNRMTQMVTSPVTTHTGQGTMNNENTDRSPDNYWNIVKIVQDMGYSSEIVQRALDRLLARRDPTITVDKLLDAVFDIENDDSTSSLEGAVGNITLEEASGDTQESNPSESHAGNTEQYSVQNKTLTDIQEMDHLSEENSQLKGKTICKVCLDNEVNMLFLPCRHLVCCEECGEALKYCPVCRTLIVGTVKAFLS